MNLVDDHLLQSRLGSNHAPRQPKLLRHPQARSNELRAIDGHQLAAYMAERNVMNPFPQFLFVAQSAANLKPEEACVRIHKSRRDSAIASVTVY
jgi:hypothetical protein